MTGTAPNSPLNVLRTDFGSLSIGERLRLLYKRSGRKAYEVANRAGMHTGTLYMVFNDTPGSTLNSVLRVAYALEADMSALFVNLPPLPVRSEAQERAQEEVGARELVGTA